MDGSTRSLLNLDLVDRVDSLLTGIPYENVPESFYLEFHHGMRQIGSLDRERLGRDIVSGKDWVVTDNLGVIEKMNGELFGERYVWLEEVDSENYDLRLELDMDTGRLVMGGVDKGIDYMRAEFIKRLGFVETYGEA